jgi:hypothetical protein
MIYIAGECAIKSRRTLDPLKLRSVKKYGVEGKHSNEGQKKSKFAVVSLNFIAESSKE